MHRCEEPLEDLERGLRLAACRSNHQAGAGDSHGSRDHDLVSAAGHDGGCGDVPLQGTDREIDAVLRGTGYRDPDLVDAWRAKLDVNHHRPRGFRGGGGCSGVGARSRHQHEARDEQEQRGDAARRALDLCRARVPGIVSRQNEADEGADCRARKRATPCPHKG